MGIRILSKKIKKINKSNVKKTINRQPCIAKSVEKNKQGNFETDLEYKIQIGNKKQVKITNHKDIPSNPK
jgi:hypothetical protein